MGVVADRVFHRFKLTGSYLHNDVYGLKAETNKKIMLSFTLNKVKYLAKWGPAKGLGAGRGGLDPTLEIYKVFKKL